MSDLTVQDATFWSVQDTVTRRLDQLVTDCVHRAGIRDYRAHTDLASRRAGVVVDKQYRARFGFGIAQSQELSKDSTEQELNAALFGDANDRTDVTIIGATRVGAPNTGCIAEARKVLGGSVQAWVQAQYMADELRDEGFRLISGNAGYRPVLSKWQQCMRKAGYSSDSPGALLTAFLTSYPQTPADTPPTTSFEDAERRAATVDATCQSQTGFLDTVPALIAKSVDDLPPDMREAGERAVQTLNNSYTRATSAPKGR